MPLDSGFNKIIKKIQENRQPKKDIFRNDFWDAIHSHKVGVQKLVGNLESLPMKYEHFDVKEINKLLEIKNKLEKYKKTNSQSSELLNEVICYLDSIDIWKTKFTTGDLDKHMNNDSIYYITKNNISLRIKRINLYKGLNHVIQPFMENITFIQQGMLYPSEKPILGSTPTEYCSEEFYQLQKQNNVNADFVSKIPKFYKNGKLYFVGKPKNPHYTHGGDIVNYIYFENS